MDESDIQRLVEDIATATVKRFHPSNWVEDPISHHLVIELANHLNGLSYQAASGANKLNVKVFKARGKKIEQVHGDIAVLVALKYHDGVTVTGAGFYEAKKRDLGKDNYGKLSYKQLTTLLKKTPHLSTLLYDYNQAMGFVDYPHGAAYCSGCSILARAIGGATFTHMLAIPANIVLVRRKKNSQLYRHGVPFSYQFVVRHLNGFDLEYDPAVIKEVSDYAKSNLVNDIVILVAKGIETDPPALPEIDLDKYEELTRDDLPPASTP